MVTLVNKPWGREYACYANDHVAVWILEIEKGKATSLHCHRHKNTALIVLQGEVELHFIHGAPMRMKGLSKINIFRGRFHRSRAVSSNVVMMEVETPDDKGDLLRLEDEYGREEKPIERATKFLEGGLHLRDNPQHVFAGCELRMMEVNAAGQLMGYDEDTIFVTLGGGLTYDLLPPGDAIDGKSLERIVRVFGPLPFSLFLQIQKAQT